VAAGADRVAGGAGDDPPRISEVVFTDPGTVRDVIHNFNRDGFDALYPRDAGGRPQTFTLPKRQEIKRMALADPSDLDLPFATWSLAKLADYLVVEGVVTDISHERARTALARGGRPLSSGEDLEALQRPRLRRQARPGSSSSAVAADEAGLGGVVGADEREVGQGPELRLDAVQPGPLERRVGESMLWSAAHLPTCSPLWG
jgi:transposase